jgi:hypothetical protein
VVKAFELRGWTVIEHYTGDAPDHEDKWREMKQWLIKQGDYAVMVNKNTCYQMILSIEQSPAKLVGGKTQKDKKTEKNINFPAEESTHFSDAFDMILWAIFMYDIINSQTGTGIPTRLS